MVQNPAPRHVHIAAALRDRIRRGELPAGSSLPSEAQLCETHGVSRGTVRQALGSLRAEGLIAGGRGKPPIVRRAGLAQSFDQLVSFSAWARTQGRTPGSRTLELSRRPASAAVAAQLEIAPGLPVYGIIRVRTLDEVPVMVERTSFVEEVGRLLVDIDIDGGSVYEQLAERGVTFAQADQRIEAIAAGGEDSDLLGVPRRAPLLQVLRRGLDAGARPIEWSADRYRGDAFAVTVHSDADPRASVLVTQMAA